MCERSGDQQQARLHARGQRGWEQGWTCRSALRRSPKPGALIATALTTPRSLLTTSVASASPVQAYTEFSTGSGNCKNPMVLCSPTPKAPTPHPEG